MEQRSTRGRPAALATPMKDKTMRGMWAAGPGPDNPDEVQPSTLRKMGTVLMEGIRGLVSPSTEGDKAEASPASRPPPATEPAGSSRPIP